MMTPEAYVESQPEPKRSELRQLDALIRRAVPEWTPVMAGSMVGYGPYHYRYDSGREGDTARLCLAANKTGISLYLAIMDAGGYLAEQAAKSLGKASVGKSCIRFKKLADLDLAAVEALLHRAAPLKGIGEI